MYEMMPVEMVDRVGDEGYALLLEVGSLIQREVAIEHLLAKMVGLIAQRMQADRGTIYLVDRGKGEVFSKAAQLPEIEEIRLQLGQGIAGHVAKTGDVINVPTTNAEARFYPGVDEATGYRTTSLLAAPMKDSRGAIIGVVQLLNKEGGAFPKEDEILLAALAAQAAEAVETTTLYRDLSRAPAKDQAPLPLSGQFNLIVGASAPLREACHRTKKAAASMATVLVRGESGTGKELFARAVHVNSPRVDGPFVKIDCASLPESLIENELFGHERGAFTGADQQSEGKIDAAQGGTLFLDEIGELPVSLQAKLLRLLQDRTYERVGGTETRSADVRIVAATNRNLEKMVEEGRFRGDLYFRIRVVEISLPPVRERGPGDIVRLAQHFLDASAKRNGRPSLSLSATALRCMQTYAWPGNVRELEHCIESAVIISEGEVIEAADLPLPDRPVNLDALHAPTVIEKPPKKLTTAGETPGIATLAEVERDHILQVLKQVGDNRTLAAELLGIGRNTLARKLKKYGL